MGKRAIHCILQAVNQHTQQHIVRQQQHVLRRLTLQQRHIQQNLHQHMQQHLQQQVVVHNHGNAQQRAAARAKANALALADRDAPMQGAELRRKRLAIDGGRVEEEDGSPNQRRRTYYLNNYYLCNHLQDIDTQTKLSCLVTETNQWSVSHKDNIMEAYVNSGAIDLVDSLSFHVAASASYVTDSRSVTLFPSGSNDYGPTGVRVIIIGLSGGSVVRPSFC